MRKIISIILALAMMMSNSPSSVMLSDANTPHAIIDNSNISKDNALVTNGTGSSASDAIELSVGSKEYDITATTGLYFTFTAPAAGTYTITMTPEEGMAIRLNVNGVTTSVYEEPGAVSFAAGETVKYQVRLYVAGGSKYVLKTGKVTITITGEGGETPNPGTPCDHVNAEGKWESDNTNHWQLCDSCGEKFNEAVHSYTDGKCVCGATDPDYCEHNWVDADCDTPKTCSKCGDTDGDALGHDKVQHEAKAATCTESGYKAYETCKRCDYTTFEEIKALGHDFKEGMCQREGCGAEDPNYVPECQHQLGAYACDIEPTCTTPGSETAGCSLCSYKHTRLVMPLGHNYVDGKCTDCDATESTVGTVNNPKQFVIGDNTGVAPTSGDKYYYFAFNAVMGGTVSMFSEGTDWRAYIYINGVNKTQELFGGMMYNPSSSNTIEVKLEANDVVVLKISNYSATSRQPIGGEITVNFQFTTECAHNFVSEGTSASCKEEGRMVYTCATCDISYAVYSRTLAHTVVTDAAVAPTCTESGLTEGSHCSECGEVIVAQTTVDDLGHTEVVDEAVAATCTKTGLTAGKHCSVCDAVLVAQTEIPLADHTSGAAVQENVVPATCTTGGSYDAVVYCSVCNAELSRANVSVNPLGHTPGEAVVENGAKATCTEDGGYDAVVYCTVCKIELERTRVTEKATGHNEVIDAAVAPTCTETGLTAGSHCSVCGDVIIAQTTVDALGHTEVVDEAVAPTCTATGLTEGKHCSVCGVTTVAQTVVAAKGHTEEIIAGKAATCTESGLTDGKKCSVCGVTTVAQTVIPATGHNYVNDECTKCHDTGIAIPEDGKLVSGQLYVYTAAKDMHLEIKFAGIQDSDGKKINYLSDATVLAQINGELTDINYRGYLAANQTIKLMLVSMNEGKTYTCSATLVETPVNFLTLGENTIEPKTEYIYIAEKAGTLYVTVIDGTVKVNGENPEDEYSVEAGEKITVTNEGETNAHIALRFVGNDEQIPGSEKNPVALPFGECPANTMEIPAGGTVYYQLSDFKNGYVLKVTGENAYILVNDAQYNAVDGVVTLKVSGNHLIQIGNTGDEIATFAMATSIPVGHQDNKAELVNGKNTVDIPAGDYYYYEFEATEACKATITVTGEYWCFTLKHQNTEVTRYAYKGDKDTVELNLEAGDRIELKLSAVNDSWQNVGGTVTADVSFGSTGVAKVGNIKYETLQEAITAAKDGDTIVLLSDLKLTHEDAQVFGPEAANQFKIMFAVTGKAITIDLNGKTISVDATTGFGEGTVIASWVQGEGMIDWKAEKLEGMLMAVIAAYDGGHLTLKDSVGGGGIQTTAWDGVEGNTVCGIVYSVLTNYSEDSSITIEGGKYEADFTRDCLVYSDSSANEGNGNVGVVVNGGTFILRNAGKGRNYSTWIFNARGQGERHIWVTGGNFNTDVFHQYWIFEAQSPEDIALKYNEETGLYETVKAVAYVAEPHGNYVKNVGYATLEEAIAACIDDAYRDNTYHANYANKTTEETVVLLADAEWKSDIVIPEGQSVVVDLNGHKLTGTISGATIIDSKNTPAQEEDETTKPEN